MNASGYGAARARGFTLIEAVVFIVVVGIAAVAAVYVWLHGGR